MSIRLPPPDLASSVDFLWSIPRERTEGAPFHELLPDSGVHLVLRLSAGGCGAALIGPATERAQGEEMARRIPGAELLALEGGDHVAIFTHRAEAQARVARFLREHAPAAR